MGHTGDGPPGSTNAPDYGMNEPRPRLIFEWAHAPNERRCECGQDGVSPRACAEHPFECVLCQRLLPGVCIRCGGQYDPERMGDLCDACIERDRAANRKVIDAMHPANRLRAMAGLSPLPAICSAFDPCIWHPITEMMPKTGTVYRVEFANSRTRQAAIYGGPIPEWATHWRFDEPPLLPCNDPRSNIPVSQLRLRDAQIKQAAYIMSNCGPLRQAEAIAQHYVSMAMMAKTALDLIKRGRQSGTLTTTATDMIDRFISDIKEAHAMDLGIELKWEKTE